MKSIAVILASVWMVTAAAAAEDSCKDQAAKQKLHGAAMTSFVKKCCTGRAAGQKLHGAAKTSFTKKCES